MHTYWCVLYMWVFDYVYVIFVCTVILQLLQGKCCCLEKEAAHNYKCHSEEDKEKGSGGGPIKKMPIYSELLGIYSRRPALCL